MTLYVLLIRFLSYIEPGTQRWKAAATLRVKNDQPNFTFGHQANTLRELKFSIPSSSVYVANDATAYSVTRDLVDSYSTMVDIETAIKSRYRLRLERILAKCKRSV